VNDKVNKKLLLAAGIAAIVLAACMILLTIMEAVVSLSGGEYEFIKAGERWSSDGEAYAVVAMYAEDGAAVSADQVGQWAHYIEAALLEASITPKEGGRSFTYCAVAEDTLQVIGPKGKATAEVMAVLGDFFVFHPMDFTYGNAFLNDPSNPMGVVIDRDLAWKLFGAENIVGMTVELGGQEFTVVGVTEKESHKGIYAHTYGQRPRLYMSYPGYYKATKKTDAITVFEVALPNSVSSFGMNIFNKVVSMNEEKSRVIEASDRFSVENRFQNMKELPYSAIRQNKIEYPYWENEAMVADNSFAVLMIFELAIAILGVTSLLLSFILLRLSGYTVTDTVKNTWRKIEEKHKNKRKSNFS